MTGFLSDNLGEDRAAAELLRRICTNGPETVASWTKGSSDLLVRLGFAELLSGSRVGATSAGRVEFAI